MAKKIYYGVPTKALEEKEVSITTSNIEDYFTITNGSYYFVGNNDTFTSNNKGVNSSTASTTLTAKKSIKNLSFSYSYSSETNYDKFTLKIANDTILNGVSGPTTTGSRVGINLITGDKLEFSYSKDNSGHTYDDQCKFYDMKIIEKAESEKTKDLARRVRRIYYGDRNSKARRVRRGYTSIGGVARPFMGDGEIVNYGVITPLSVARTMFTATSIGNYALFAGGYISGNTSTSTLSAVVDAYDTSLVRSNPTSLSTGLTQLAATSVGNYALFGGGNPSVNSSRSNNVNAYDTSLTRTSPTALTESRSLLAATNVGNYALFAGGDASNNKHQTDTVDAYDTSLTRTTPAVLSSSRAELTATSVGNYALFAGGSGAVTYTSGTGLVINSGSHNEVDAYNSSLTRTIATILSASRYNLAATTVGNYALFAGGHSRPDTTQTSTYFYADIVDAYNSSLTRTTITSLIKGRWYLSATTVGNYALFAGGYASSVYNDVDAYDTSLTRTSYTLSTTKFRMAATTVGNYALFAGGQDTNSSSSNNLDTVEAFKYIEG